MGVLARLYAAQKDKIQSLQNREDDIMALLPYLRHKLVLVRTQAAGCMNALLSASCSNSFMPGKTVNTILPILYLNLVLESDISILRLHEVRQHQVISIPQISMSSLTVLLLLRHVLYPVIQITEMRADDSASYISYEIELAEIFVQSAPVQIANSTHLHHDWQW